MQEWSFQHSGRTHASRVHAWAFWTDMGNHVKMEPGVLNIELDGPFVTGTTGRTITTEYTQPFELTEVIDGERFVITGFTPDGTGALSFAWTFEDDGDGTRLTQRISAYGPDVETALETFRQMEVHAPRGMMRLVAELDRLARVGDRTNTDGVTT